MVTRENVPISGTNVYVEKEEDGDNNSRAVFWTTESGLQSFLDTVTDSQHFNAECKCEILISGVLVQTRLSRLLYLREEYNEEPTFIAVRDVEESFEATWENQQGNSEIVLLFYDIKQTKISGFEEKFNLFFSETTDSGTSHQIDDLITYLN